MSNFYENLAKIGWEVKTKKEIQVFIEDLYRRLDKNNKEVLSRMVEDIVAPAPDIGLAGEDFIKGWKSKDLISSKEIKHASDLIQMAFSKRLSTREFIPFLSSLTGTPALVNGKPNNALERRIRWILKLAGFEYKQARAERHITKKCYMAPKGTSLPELIAEFNRRINFAVGPELLSQKEKDNIAVSFL